MTREEIIDGLQFTIDMFLFNPNTGENREEYELNDMDKTTIDACKGAIELLKQEPILDKIRAEINTPNRGTCDYFIVDRIEEIIDKYKSESEGKG